MNTEKNAANRELEAHALNGWLLLAITILGMLAGAALLVAAIVTASTKGEFPVARFVTGCWWKYSVPFSPAVSSPSSPTRRGC